MSYRWLIQIVLLAGLLNVTAVLALDGRKDVEGSKDHPLLKRYQGSALVKYDHKEFNEYELPLGQLVEGRFTEALKLEGEVTRLVYSVPKGRSTLEIMRNYEMELKAKGYVVLQTLSGKDANRTPFAKTTDGTWRWDRVYGVDGQYRLGVWKLSRKEGDAHVALFLSESWEGDSMMSVEKGGVLIYADVVVKKPMETNKLVGLVGAQDMADQISASGRVSLYGLYFDTNKTELKSESEPTLGEMAKLLKAQPNLTLLVVGHTDNVGTYKENADLSQRRAQAVINALIAKHGIAKDRLTPVGDSFSAPVASNKTEDGRAKNRRVELVEQ